MIWTVDENKPNLIGGTVTVDGVEIHQVFAIYSTPDGQGLVRANCLYDHTNPGRDESVDDIVDLKLKGVHTDPVVGNDICTTTFTGEVKVWNADGERVA